MLREVTVWLPPQIASSEIVIASKLATDIEDCLREIAALDASHGGDLGALGMMLLRTESVASSKIEEVEADLDDYARALHGIRSNKSALSMAAATAAFDRMLNDSVSGSDLTAITVLRHTRR